MKPRRIYKTFLGHKLSTVLSWINEPLCLTSLTYTNIRLPTHGISPLEQVEFCKRNLIPLGDETLLSNSQWMNSCKVPRTIWRKLSVLNISIAFYILQNIFTFRYLASFFQVYIQRWCSNYLNNWLSIVIDPWEQMLVLMIIYLHRTSPEFFL